MKTNFFTQMRELCKEHDFNMTFKAKDDTITLAIYPKAKVDVVKEDFPPLTFSATAEELDEKFFESIKNAMVKTSNIVSTISFFAKQMEEKKKQAETKALNKKTTTPAKPAAPVKKVVGDIEEEEEETTEETTEQTEMVAEKKQETLFD